MSSMADKYNQMKRDVGIIFNYGNMEVEVVAVTILYTYSGEGEEIEFMYWVTTDGENRFEIDYDRMQEIFEEVGGNE